MRDMHYRLAIFRISQIKYDLKIENASWDQEGVYMTGTQYPGNQEWSATMWEKHAS